MNIRKRNLARTDKITKKTRRAFNKLASTYDTEEALQEPRKCYAPVMKIIKKRTNKELKLLDVGCGTGVMLKSICREFPKAIEISGIDLSPAMVKKANSNLMGYKAHVIKGKIETVALPKEFYNVALCMHSFHHYPYPLKSLKRLCSTLCKNGMLIMADNYYEGWSRIKRNWELRIRDYPDGDMWMYSCFELSVLTKLAGFQKQQCYRVGKKSFIFICQKK